MRGAKRGIEYILIIAITISMLIPMSGVACVYAANSPSLETHQYQPIAEEHSSGRRSSDCTDPTHPDDPICPLRALVRKSASDAVTTTNASVKDVKLTTLERNKLVKNGKLESTIVSKANVQFAAANGGEMGQFSVSGIESVDLIKFIQPLKGYVAVPVKLILEENGTKVGFMETNVYIVYAKEKEKKKNDEEVVDEDPIDDEEYVDDEGEGEESKKDDAAKKAKEKAEKEKLKKHTAQISQKEREKQDSINVDENNKDKKEDRNDAPGWILLGGALVAAIIYGRSIRSDMRLLRWHKQKKALRKK